MDYKEITVTTTHDCADLVSLILIEEGSEGVSVKGHKRRSRALFKRYYLGLYR